MSRLIEGDVSPAVPHLDDSNETGRIAQTVAAFKESLIETAKLREDGRRQEALSNEQRAAEQVREAETARCQAQVVTSLAQGLEKLSGGVLTYRLDQAFAAEYEKLRADFNAAMQQLQETMKIVAANTAGIRSGTGEITQASDDLSRRTEQQAASLEETAAALDEITATVRKTAQGANEAREVVSAAKTDAEHSGAVVKDAVAAMSEIESSSRQISQIIGVIDEIAFQTNLLALNAGVEAARAGDAGKGFAVVASEVRALAQRSAEAAKEIKALISSSSQQVGRGVNLVGETGQALERIVAQVTQINGVVAEIAASAQEQAVGLAQVNTAVNQMDQVTQQNAAMVEQSTAASHALAQETEELSRLIGRFEVGEPVRVEQIRSRPRPVSSQAPRVAMRTASARSGGAARAPEPDSWDEF
jgi:methyl-accepting chemotaxis protein